MAGLECGLQHMPQFVFVFWRHADHVREHPQIRHVVDAVMCWAVRAGDSAAIEGEHHRQIHDCHVVKDLIERALEKCRVDCRDRPHSLRGHSPRERHRVFFRNAHIEHAIRKYLREFIETGPLGHRRGDGHDFRIALGELDECLRENIRVRRGRRLVRFFYLAGNDVERRYAMRPNRLVLRRHVAFALFRDDVYQDRSVVILVFFEDVDQRVEIVSVVRSQIFESELLEKSSGNDHVLEELLHVVREFVELSADERNAIHHALGEILRLDVALTFNDLIEISAHRTDVRRDRHVVVVEHEKELSLQMSGLIETLEGQAAGERAIADHGHDAIILFSCPALKTSYSDSSRLQNPEMPSCWRMVWNRSRRPVINLCG